MKLAGLNTVRIQIGCKSPHIDGTYEVQKRVAVAVAEALDVVWSIIPLQNEEPFLVGAYPYLKVAVDWAQTLGLKVSDPRFIPDFNVPLPSTLYFLCIGYWSSTVLKEIDDDRSSRCAWFAKRF